MHILIAEDEDRIARFIKKGLVSHGFTCAVVSDGIHALDQATADDIDLVILDVGLPRMDGFTVLKNMRSLGVNTPVIMVTARTAVEDTVQGFASGANDYISKPFRFEELLARIHARLADAQDSDDEDQSTLSLGGLTVDVRDRTATVSGGSGGERVELSSREFGLVCMFLENPNQVLTRSQILSRVWGHDHDGSSNVVDVYVKSLRAKLGAERFVTVRGAGYKLIDA